MDQPDPDRKSLSRRLALLACVVLALVALASAWSWSPLRAWLNVSRIVTALEHLGQSYGPVAAIFGFTLAVSLAVPLSFLILVSIVAFGPLKGFIYSMVAATIGAAITFLIGQWLGHEAVQRLGGERVNAVSQRLASRGILAVIALRLVPIAPFAIVNMIAGASHLRLRDLLIGTVIGMLPGTLAMMLFVDQLIEAMKRPSSVTALIGLLMALLIGLGIWGLRRWLRHSGERRPL